MTCRFFREKQKGLGKKMETKLGARRLLELRESGRMVSHSLGWFLWVCDTFKFQPGFTWGRARVKGAVYEGDLLNYWRGILHLWRGHERGTGRQGERSLEAEHNDLRVREAQEGVPMLRSPLEGDKPNLAHCKGNTHTPRHAHSSPLSRKFCNFILQDPNRKNVTQMSTGSGGNEGLSALVVGSGRERRPRSAGERTRE